MWIFVNLKITFNRGVPAMCTGTCRFVRVVFCIIFYFINRLIWWIVQNHPSLSLFFLKTCPPIIIFTLPVARCLLLARLLPPHAVRRGGAMVESYAGKIIENEISDGRQTSHYTRQPTTLIINQQPCHLILSPWRWNRPISTHQRHNLSSDPLLMIWCGY